MWADIMTLVRKDLRIEFRNKENFTNVLFFSVAVVLIFSFALDAAQRAELLAAVAPGLMWLTVTFAGTMIVSRAFTADQQHGALRAILLSPLRREAIFLSKMTTAMAMLLTIEVVLAFLMAMFFGLPIGLHPGLLALGLLLGTLGFCSVGLLFSAMLMRSRLRELLLPVLFYPVIIPMLVAGTKTTEIAMTADAHFDFNWVSFLAGCDLIFLTAAYLLFPTVVAEDR